MIRGFYVGREDALIYEKEFADRLPQRIIDGHVHIWDRKCLNIKPQEYGIYKQYKPWTDFDLMEEFTIENFQACAEDTFAGREYGGVFFGLPFPQVDRERSNRYVMDAAGRTGNGFYYMPGQFEDALLAERKYGLLERKGFLGFKPYPDLVEAAEGEISIYDMLNRTFLEMADKYGLYIMLHIPGKGRMRDERIRRQLHVITNTYQNAGFIIAHVGRSFCYADVEGSIDFLVGRNNVWFDMALINDPLVLEYLFQRAAPERIIFGSDAPLAFVRGKDICVNNRHYYVSGQAVPWGLVPGKEGLLNLTYYLYEEIRAILYASKAVYGDGEREKLERIFFRNMWEILKERGCSV